MPESRDVTTSRIEFRTYRLGRSQLDRLFAVASEGADAERLKFKTTRSGTTFTRKTLEELVSAVAASPLPGDPEVWSEVDFSYYDDQKSVSIEIGKLGVRVWISAPDATWVHGQAARIRALLEPVAGEEAPWRTRWRLWFKIGFLGGTFAWVAAFFMLEGANGNTERALAATLIGMLTWSAVMAIGTAGEGKSKTLLHVAGEASESGWWKNLSTSDKIALGSVAAAAIAAIAALGSAYSDLWGSKK